MNILETSLHGLKIVEPKIYGDSRGYFLETWSRKRYAEVGIDVEFVQDNLSFSSFGVIRGLHFQYPPDTQGKLVYVLQGEVFDVAVDIRKDSPTFGKWEGVVLSDENKRQVYVPEGFAHGFCVLSETVLFAYKCTAFYNPQAEGGILWNDPGIGIKWPVSDPILSDKDAKYPLLKDWARESVPDWGGFDNNA
jgi:dTDP-4-dehydrorhamnose 3,5-epimerase